MTFTNTIKVDVGHPWKTAQVYVKQGDKDSRKIRAELMNGAASWTIPVGTVATFRAKKPDDTVVTQDATIGSPNIVEVVLDEQVGAVFGVVHGEIRLVNGGEILNTFLIAINVEAAAVTDGDIVSRDVLDEYQALVDQMLAVAGSPLVANAAADMTDKTRVYVYTGSEAGYVTGDWYFWDGAAWTAGGAYNSQGIGDAFIEQTAEYIKQSSIATESDSTPYLYRPTPNPSAILADEEIVGGTIAYNQIVPNGNFADGTTGWAGGNASISASAGVLTITPTNTTNNRADAKVSTVQNHKYLRYVEFKGTDGNFVISWYGGNTRVVAFTGSWQLFTDIIDNTSSSSTNWHLYYGSNTNPNLTPYQIKNAMCFDLTAMFGSTIADYLYTLESGTAGAGVAKLREWGFLSKDYFAYDAGSLVSVNTSGKRVVGGNVWDEQWEIGGISTSNGANIAQTDRFRSVNKIRVIPGVTYYFFRNAYSQSKGVYYYDANETFIPNSYVDLGTQNVQFTIPTNAHYMRFVIKATSYTGGINIAPSSGFNGVYVPYRQPTTYSTTPTDLNGIFKLDSNNNLYADGDVYESDGTVTRRFTDLDLGQRNWTYVSAENRFYTSVPDADFPTDNTKVADIICAEYPTVDYATLLTLTQDKVISAWKSGSVLYIIVRDTGYSSAAAFKTAMSGVYAYYKLATPTTDAADPYTATQIVGKGGTEEWIDSRAVPVPVGHNTTYYIGVPDVPSNANNATLHATVSGGKTTLSWS